MSAAAPALTVAEELRQAAALIRERAEAATPGPWKHMCLGSDGCIVVRTTGTKQEKMRGRIAKFGWKDWHADHADAVHVAGWSAPVALAVADWLEEIARQYDAPPCDDPSGVCTPCEWRPDFNDALRVARAYLDEGSD